VTLAKLSFLNISKILSEDKTSNKITIHAHVIDNQCQNSCCVIQDYTYIISTCIVSDTSFESLRTLWKTGTLSTNYVSMYVQYINVSVVPITVNVQLFEVSGLTIFNERSYLTFKSINHRGINLF